MILKGILIRDVIGKSLDDLERSGGQLQEPSTIGRYLKASNWKLIRYVPVETGEGR